MMDWSGDAVVCKSCGERKTRHPSGLCARCQRKADSPVRLCKCCEQRRTRDESGLCYLCRNKAVTKNYDIGRIEYAIERTKTALAILEKKRDGLSFRKIAEELDMPRSSVDNIFRNAVYNGTRSETKYDTWTAEADELRKEEEKEKKK